MSKAAVKQLLDQELEKRPYWLVVTSEDRFMEYKDCTIQELADELAWEHERYGQTWGHCRAYDKEMNAYIIYPDGSYDEVE